MKKVFLGLVSCWLLMPLAAWGGVSQGNPKRSEFYNMKADYRVRGTENWNFSSDTSAEDILVTLPLRFGIDDRFTVVRHPSAVKLKAGEKVCEKRFENGLKLEIFWIGKTCQNQDVRALFDTFVSSIVPLKFSK